MPMRHIGKKAVLAALIFASLGMMAHAADPGYTGRIDPQTGAALDNREPLSAASAGGRVYVSSGVYYDYDRHSFVYPLDSGAKEVYCTAADGMALSSTNISVQLPQDAPVVIYKDGAEYTGLINEIRDTGEYSVVSQVDGRSRQLLKFTILGASTNALHTFTVPDGFYVEEALRDEENAYLDRYSVDMEAEGLYHIVYVCSATGASYTLDTLIDRTPPELTLSARFDDRMRTRSAVRFTGLQPGDKIRATNTGETAVPELNNDNTGGAFYDMGDYTFTVFDEAGNSTTYEFTILTYFNTNSLMFFALVLLCAASVFLYIRFKRKRLKIG